MKKIKKKRSGLLNPLGTLYPFNNDKKVKHIMFETSNSS